MKINHYSGRDRAALRYAIAHGRLWGWIQSGAQQFEKILLVGWRLEKKLGGHDYNINLLEKSGGGAQFLEVNLTHS